MSAVNGPTHSVFEELDYEGAYEQLIKEILLDQKIVVESVQSGHFSCAWSFQNSINNKITVSKYLDRLNRGQNYASRK